MSPAANAGSNTPSWRTILGAFPNPAFVHGPDGRLLHANEAFVAMMRLAGYPDGMQCAELMRWDECPANKKASATSVNPASTELRLHDNGLFCVAMTSSVVGADGKIATIHSFTDVSQLSEAATAAERADGLLQTRDKELRDSREAFFNMLEDIGESYAELEDMFMSLLRAMVGALDAKSPWTRGHSERVARLTETVARSMGLEEDAIRDLHLSGLLHDIGKIGTYDVLLEKPGPLTPDEFEIMKKHPAQGAMILQNIKQLRRIIPYVRHHHERYDGRGYPDGLKGDEIPLPARILHAADSFDAMTSSRPYREAPGVLYAMREIERYAGIQFDPDVAHAFLALFEKDPGIFV